MLSEYRIVERDRRVPCLGITEQLNKLAEVLHLDAVDLLDDLRERVVIALAECEGNIGEVTITSSSPSKAGRSPRRVARGLPMIASAAAAALPGRSRAAQNSRLALEKTSGP